MLYMKNLLVGGFLLSGTVVTANAALSTQFVESSTNLSGYVTSNLVITTDTDWLTGQALIVLSSGSIYDNSFGSNSAAPNPSLVAVFPDLAYDSYVYAPNGATASVPSGAINIGGGLPVTWTSTKIDVGWADSPTTDIGTFSIAQFTFSNDANGTFAFRVASANQTPSIISGTIVNGHFVLANVPEPASVGVLGLAGVGLLLKRRK